MLKPLVTAAAVLAVLAAPAVALDGPEEAVKALYRDGQPDTAAEADRWLARDLASAYKRDLKMDEPQPSTDFDWRYGNQEWDVSELNVGRSIDLPSVGGVTLRDVPVNFKDFNQPKLVTWRMCLGKKGWRVADVRGLNPDGSPWSLREMMQLPADRIKC